MRVHLDWGEQLSVIKGACIAMVATAPHKGKGAPIAQLSF